MRFTQIVVEVVQFLMVIFVKADQLPIVHSRNAVGRDLAAQPIVRIMPKECVSRQAVRAFPSRLRDTVKKAFTAQIKLSSSNGW